MSDLLWTVDLNLRTTYISPSVETLLGYSVEERLQQEVKDQLAPESLVIVQDKLVKKLRRAGEQRIVPEEAVALTLDFLHKKGSVVSMESVMSFIQDETGSPIGIHGLSRDITERKKAEQALRQSEEFNRRLVENAPFGIVYLEGDGTVEYVNPAAKRIAGLGGEISELLAGLQIGDHGADGHRHEAIVAAVARAVVAAAALAVLGLEGARNAKIREGVHALDGSQIHAAAQSAVATIGAAEGHELLAPEAHAAAAAVAGLHLELGFVDEFHGTRARCVKTKGEQALASSPLNSCAGEQALAPAVTWKRR